MKAVMLGWSEEDIKTLGNNTLMLNYHTHAWNKTIQGKQAVQSGFHEICCCFTVMTAKQNTGGIEARLFPRVYGLHQVCICDRQQTSKQKDSGDSDDVKAGLKLLSGISPAFHLDMLMCHCHVLVVSLRKQRNP